MNEALSPAQDAAVRAIVAEMLAQVLHGAGDRLAEAINGAIVLLPVFHAGEIARTEAQPSSGKGNHVSGEPC